MPEKKKDFPVIDVDSHVLEPAAIWDEYVPADYRALARSSFWHEFADQGPDTVILRSEEHTSELQSRRKLVCRLRLEKKKYIR